MFTLTRNHNITWCCKNHTKTSRSSLEFQNMGEENNKKFKVYVRTIHTFYCSGSEAECL
jgi:hypothetical protein